MRLKHVFIINPISGDGSYRQLLSWLMKQENLDYEIKYTEYIGHAKALAHEAGQDAIVYAVGGDGTAHEVLNGLHKDAVMGVIPTGTGNDFYKMIGDKSKLIEMIEQTVLHGVVRKIDVGKMNGDLFLNCTNVGIDADINMRANKMRYKFISRKFVYLIAALIEVFSIKPYPFEIKKDDDFEPTAIALLSVMNGKYYGNGFKSAPDASLDDGYLDLCHVAPVTFLRALSLLPKYMKGNHLGLPEVTYEKIKKLEIRSEQTLVVGCDGEVLKTNSIEIEVLPKYLNLRVPSKA